MILSSIVVLLIATMFFICIYGFVDITKQLNSLDDDTKSQEELIALYGEDILLADGLNEAIIGIDRNSERIVYSVRKIIDILIIRDHMSEEEALEHFSYNIEGGYVGEQTPIWCYDLDH